MEDPALGFAAAADTELQSRLPGLAYEGDDPDGFMTMPEVIEFVDRYAAASEAPVRTHTTVSAVRPGSGEATGWSPTRGPGRPRR